MSQETAPLPGFWRFVWLTLMQPSRLSTLYRDLGHSGRWWELLRWRRSPHGSWLLVRYAQVLLLAIPGAALAAATLTAASRLYADDRLRLALEVGGGVTLGVVGIVAGSVGGYLACAAYVGATVGAVAGIGGPLTTALAIGVALGLSFEMIGPVALSAIYARTGLVGIYLFSAVFEGLLSFTVGAILGKVHGKNFGMAVAAAFFITQYRFPIFVLEIIFQTAAWCWNLITGHKSLQWVPVLYHEQSLLPYPFLESHVLAEADADPSLTRRVLEACSVAPGQRRTGRRVEAKLRARELKRLAEGKDFQAIAELRGLWLPGIQGADGLLLSFSEAGRYLAAARAAFNPHHQLKHLDGFAAQLNAIENQLRVTRDAFAQPFEEPLETLRRAGQAMRAEAEKKATGLIPNPFRAGDPLSDEEGPELFRGRETAVREIEEILADPTRAASLQLLAPRRAGKTSLLKMLPRLLPDTVCVFFDLQAHPVASVGAFWNKLAEQSLIQAKLDRRAELPKLPDGPPMEAAAAWLEKLDQLPNGRRVLIAIDEFERLEDLFPGSKLEFLQLMGLFRATIQHRRGVRLLVSGAAPFDELNGVWDDHFISARQIKLPFLDQPTSSGLLTQPSPDFPSEAIPEAAADEVFKRTGGQPYLVQLFGSLLVSLLNDQKRKTASVADVQAVEGRAIERAETYFRDTFKSAPELARDALGHLALGEPVDLTPAARRWLTQRYLLTPDDRLAIPIFGAWIAHHALV
jgi:hypothetical protein